MKDHALLVDSNTVSQIERLKRDKVVYADLKGASKVAYTEYEAAGKRSAELTERFQKGEECGAEMRQAWNAYDSSMARMRATREAVESFEEKHHEAVKQMIGSLVSDIGLGPIEVTYLGFRLC